MRNDRRNCRSSRLRSPNILEKMPTSLRSRSREPTRLFSPHLVAVARWTLFESGKAVRKPTTSSQRRVVQRRSVGSMNWQSEKLAVRVYRKKAARMRRSLKDCSLVLLTHRSRLRLVAVAPSILFVSGRAPKKPSRTKRNMGRARNRVATIRREVVARSTSSESGKVARNEKYLSRRRALLKQSAQRKTNRKSRQTPWPPESVLVSDRTRRSGLCGTH